MPALVGTLNRSSSLAGSTALTFAGEQAGEEVMKEDALDWATAGVFVCRKECTNDGGEAWREEVVLIEWEQ